MHRPWWIGEDSVDTVRKKYLAAAFLYYPNRWNPALHPEGPEPHWNALLRDYRDTLTRHEVNADKAAGVIDHLLDKWPHGLLAFNASYVIGHAREMGMLDREFIPVRQARALGELPSGRARWSVPGLARITAHLPAPAHGAAVRPLPQARP